MPNVKNGRNTLQSDECSCRIAGMSKYCAMNIDRNICIMFRKHQRLDTIQCDTHHITFDSHTNVVVACMSFFWIWFIIYSTKLTRVQSTATPDDPYTERFTNIDFDTCRKLICTSGP